MSGPVMSMVLLIISFLMPSSVLQYALFSVNIGCLIFSLFPVFLKNNDLASLIQYIRVKKYRVIRSRSVAVADEADNHDPKKDA